MQMKLCDATCVCCEIVLDGMCLHRGATRGCMSVFFETCIAPNLFVVELIIFGWSKKPSLFNVVSELKVK